MLELFRASGYEVVPFDADADVYVLNTCTVTGTGDKKSMQIVRRLRREHPLGQIVLCGCLAQRKGEELRGTGARLILGTQRRNEVVALLERAVREQVQLCAVAPLEKGMPFEELTIDDQEAHTRAILKIQEGCNNHCTYCIIPSVRGPIRSRPLDEIRSEAARLAARGVREIVVTGIHLSSYGRDLAEQPSLTDALQCLQDTPGIERIRLGSLEPNIATPAFAATLAGMHKICPQFHLALQSGSDGVLKRMARRYTAAEYRAGVANLRAAFPQAAFTTDVLTGFPAETEQEYQETRAMIEAIGFARIHVFPYSPREGTPAARMAGALSNTVKEERARALIALGQQTSEAYRRGWLGRQAEILLEEADDTGWVGYTREYIPVSVPLSGDGWRGRFIQVRLTGLTKDGMTGEAIDAIHTR